MYNFTKKCPEHVKDKAKIEQCLDGNLCRCTGYRPILDAFKSVADTPYDSSKTDPTFPEFLKSHVHVSKRYTADGKEWISPVSLPEVFEAVKQL